jgi:hypothetical protein
VIDDIGASSSPGASTDLSPALQSLCGSVDILSSGFAAAECPPGTAPIDDPEFWNPKQRAPICFNAAAARSYLPRTVKKTDLILTGHTKAQMIEAIAAAIDKNELPAMEPGAMCYMLSK